MIDLEHPVSIRSLRGGSEMVMYGSEQGVKIELNSCTMFCALGSHSDRKNYCRHH